MRLRQCVWELWQRTQSIWTHWVAISPQQTPTGGSPDGKRRSPHHSTSPLGNGYAHSPLREKDWKYKNKYTLNRTDALYLLIFWIVTVDHHVISNDSGWVEGSFSGACCWETGVEGCPKPPVHVEHISVVHPHAEPWKNNKQSISQTGCVWCFPDHSQNVLWVNTWFYNLTFSSYVIPIFYWCA